MIPDFGVKGGERKFQNSESDFQLLLGAFSTPLGPIDATRSQKPLLTSNPNLLLNLTELFCDGCGD